MKADDSTAPRSPPVPNPQSDKRIAAGFLDPTRLERMLGGLISPERGNQFVHFVVAGTATESTARNSPPTGPQTASTRGGIACDLVRECSNDGDELGQFRRHGSILFLLSGHSFPHFTSHLLDELYLPSAPSANVIFGLQFRVFQF